MIHYLTRINISSLDGTFNLGDFFGILAACKESCYNMW